LRKTARTCYYFYGLGGSLRLLLIFGMPLKTAFPAGPR